MVDPVGDTVQTSELLRTSSNPAAPESIWPGPQSQPVQGQASVNQEAIESQIALVTLLLMNQELSRSRLQLEQRLREAQQEES